MRILTVPEVTAYIKDLIELDPILSDVWIRGEVSNLSRSAAGHMYFCLAADGIQINCVLFRGSQVGILAVPRNGEDVLAHGRVSIYESRGQYQLIVDNVAPVGMGVMQLQFEETKRRLEQEGLFSEDRKRPLPALPAVIGVVTSAQGAVWHDIQTVVARRFPLTQLILAPSTVQGPDAPGHLIEGLRALEALGSCDVVIVGRGGGAAEDLAAFNDERLARAIFACSVPVVSAVGHETDTCIADLVADVRASTPTAAAELCVPNGRDLLLGIGQLVIRARESADDVRRANRDAFTVQQSVLRRHHPRTRLATARQDVDALHERVRTAQQTAFDAWRSQLQAELDRAKLLDPRDVLRRGYAAVSTTDGPASRVRSADVARGNQCLRLTFADGDVDVDVNVTSR